MGSLSPGDPESQAQDHGGYQGAGDREDVIAATANIRKRAKECLKARGGHFEFRLKKKTRGVVEARIVYEYKDMKPTKPNVLCRQSLQVKSRG